jgi:heme-degrading monooxygenase HmoA
MYIAMNRFKVALGSEVDFEHMWMSRESHLHSVPGFVEFHLLKGPQRSDHVLYASHSIWEDHAAFEAWTQVGRIPGRAQPGWQPERQSAVLYGPPGI